MKTRVYRDPHTGRWCVAYAVRGQVRVAAFCCHAHAFAAAFRLRAPAVHLEMISAVSDWWIAEAA